jgi:hypothetical protein
VFGLMRSNLQNNKSLSGVGNLSASVFSDGKVSEDFLRRRINAIISHFSRELARVDFLNRQRSINVSGQ